MITEDEGTTNGNLEPGATTDLVDRVGELDAPEPLKKKATAKTTKKKAKK